ncbi:MAG: aspartate carbamoyltransferase catalytic subunit [Alphaproteobacteria bacterium]|nr:aspartate carbamoyltransferase catalytic subunit [Alphaproteobacteria bacterium]
METFKHLISIQSLSNETIDLIFKTAKEFKEILQRPVKKVPSLHHKTVVNLFYENSTRTRLSFELAEKRLSADVLNFTVSGSSVAKGETLLDTVKNILSMKVDMVVIRHHHSGAPYFLSQHISIPIINAGDGINEHPTQALLDVFSIIEKTGSIQGKKVAIIGDIMHSRVGRSNIMLLTKLGAEVMICGPGSLIPIGIEKIYPVRIEYDITKALQWCDVANVLRIQLERQQQPLLSSLREYNLQYGITQKRMHALNKPILILHPGPINRGVEIDSNVVDGASSIVLEQVENGVAIRMALLYLLSQNH